MVAYLTACLSLTLAGFKPGKTVLAPAIGGSVGNAVTQLARAMGASHAISSTTGYAAGRKSTIDVTDLIWKRGSIRSFSLFAQPPDSWTAAWNMVIPLLRSAVVNPIVARTFALEHAADALRFLIEERPFGRVVVTL
jgi:NADPH:quinone reductase